MSDHLSYHISDEALLARLVTGDGHAFTLLYDRYHTAVAQYLQQLVKSPVLAEDLTQETFIRIWSARAQLGAVHSFKAYLFTVARNHALNGIKKSSSEQAVRTVIIQHYRQLRNDTEETLLTRAYLQHVHRILQTLPPQTREVFRLCREQEQSYEAAAQQLGISRNAVKKHMVRSMKVLKTAAERDLGISFSVLLALVHQI